MFLCLKLSCSTLLDPELSAGEDQCLIPPVILRVPVNSTTQHCKILQFLGIGQGNQRKEWYSWFLTRLFYSSPGQGALLSGPRKQEVKGPCCSYKEMLKIQKLIGV